MFDFETASIAVVILTPIYAFGFKMVIDMHDFKKDVKEIKNKFISCKYCLKG